MADDVGSSHVRTDFGELSDAELVRATRDGSRRAYAALWKRHSLSALKYARTLTASDADDVVSEAFLKVYAAIKAGRGPEEDFRYYIRSAVRNTYVSMVRARRSVPAGDAIEDVVGDGGAEIASVRSFDGSATVRAFLSLPERWQEVLWYTEVEGLSRERTAAVLGINANAVSALSFRAREALRTAWLQEHISTRSDLDRGCGAITPLLGAYSRRGLSRRDRLRVEHHVNGCEHCTSVVGELSELLTPGRLALILLPVALTGGGFAALASKMGGGSAVLASAATIATPAATVVATVGGSAATGAAALTVVGKVAAVALVATMIVPPTQLLIEAAHHPARHTESASAHTDGTPDPGPVLQVDAVVDGVDSTDDAAQFAPEEETDASSPEEPRADRWAHADEPPRAVDFAGGGNAAENANLGASANEDAGGAIPADTGRPSVVGNPDSGEKANPNANPKKSESAVTASDAKVNSASASPTGGGASTPTDKKSSPGTASDRANPTSTVNSSASGGTKATGAVTASAGPSTNASAGAGGSAGERDTARPSDIAGPSGPGDKANANAGAAGPNDTANAGAAGPNDTANANASGTAGPSDHASSAAGTDAHASDTADPNATGSGNGGGASASAAGGTEPSTARSTPPENAHVGVPAETSPAGLHAAAPAAEGMPQAAPAGG